MLWSEKYRPETVDECVLPQATKTLIKAYIDEGNIPNLLFKGPPGIGKTTLARAIVNELGWESIFINASNERNIDTLRDKVTTFVTSISVINPDKPKVVILDEADNLNPQSFQPALRSFMEEHSDSVRFIMTCNYLNKIITPLQSRCTTVEVSVKSRQDISDIVPDMLARVCFILDENSIEYDRKDIAELARTLFPDWRRLINEIQKQSTATGKIVFSKEQLELSIDEFLEAIVKKDFDAARTYIVKNSHVETEVLLREVIRQLMKAPRLDRSCIPGIFILMNEYQYKDAFVADKELNRAAFAAELITECKWK